MKKPQVLVANVDVTQDEKHALSILNEIHTHDMGVIYTDFWNIPPYITKAISNGDVDVIVLSSLPESSKETVLQLEKQLKNINRNNTPILVIEDDSNLVRLIENKSSIILATNDIIQKIKNIIESKKKIHKKPEKIAHIGIAVRNIKEALPFYIESLGLELEAIEVVKSEGVKVAFLKVGESRIELLEPLSDSSTVQRFIENRGEGVHHVALEVDRIQARLTQFKADGIKLINKEPKHGANQSQIAFIHPKSTNGVLFELCQFKVERN